MGMQKRKIVKKKALSVFIISDEIVEFLHGVKYHFIVIPARELFPSVQSLG